MARKYIVQVPIAGVASIEVTADSDEDAIEKALSYNDFDDFEIEELDVYKTITTGNVLWTPLNTPRIVSYQEEGD